MNLRVYQRECNEKVVSELSEHSSTLFVLPTGTGKTISFAHLIKNTPKRALVLAHRKILINQAADKIQRVTGEKCAIEMGDSWSNESNGLLNAKARIVVSTVQSQISGVRGDGRMSRFDPKEFSLLIIDESHRSTSDSYQKVIEYYRQNPELKIVGCTATPDRADEAALGEVYETVAFEYELPQAIEDGWLVPIHQRQVFVESLDFSSVRTTAGDLNGADLAAVMEYEANLHKVADPLYELAAGRPTVVFAASVAHAERLAEILNRHSAQCARAVSASTPDDTRTEIFSELRNGKIQFLVNVGICTEGWDEPCVSVVAMARPTKSRALYSQMTGRGTRTDTGVVDINECKNAEDRREVIKNSTKPCVAEGTLVLTNRGEVPIEDVKITDLVWDGLTFVSHGGSVFRGVKRVIEYAGLTATEDHEVWVNDKTSESTIFKTWKTFGECAAKQIPISVTGFGRKTIWESEGCYRRGSPDKSKSGTLTCRVLDLWHSNTQGYDQCFSNDSGLQEMRSTGTCSGMASSTLQSSKTKMRKPKRNIMEELWGTGDSISIFSAAGNGNVDSEQFGITSQFRIGQNRQQCPLRSGQSKMGVTKSSMFKSKQKTNQSKSARISFVSSRDSLFSGNPEEKAKIWNDMESNSSSTSHEANSSTGSIQRTARVFDIINAGPHHRFTANGLLVSNCMEVIDFVGNSGRHSLVTAADILGGKFSDEAVERVKQENGNDEHPTRDVLEQLRAAEKKIAAEKAASEAAAAKRRHIVGTATYRTSSNSPFEILGVSPAKTRGWDSVESITDKQRSVLQSAGIENVEGITFSQVSQLISEIFQRRKDGRCTYKQAKVLKKYGYDGNMSFADAKITMDALAKNGWKKPSGGSPVAAHAQDTVSTPIPQTPAADTFWEGSSDEVIDYQEAPFE